MRFLLARWFPVMMMPLKEIGRGVHGWNIFFKLNFDWDTKMTKFVNFSKSKKISNNYITPIYLQVLKDPSATMVVLVASLQDHLSCCIDSTNLTPQEANENLLNFISDITDTLEHTPGQNITTALVG